MLPYVCVVDEDEERRKRDDLREAVAGQCYFHSDLNTSQRMWTTHKTFHKTLSVSISRDSK